MIASPAGQPRKVAISRPSPTGRIVALKRGSASTAVSNARSAVVFASSGAAGRVPETRPLHRTLSATTSAPGARRPDERLEVGRVLGLERVDEGEVERPVERRFARAERVERRGVDDRDPVVGDARLAPPAAGQVGPRAVRVDRDDRAVGRLAERQPERRVADRPCRPRRSAAGRRRAPAAPGRCRGRRSGSRVRLGGRFDRGERRRQRRRERLDPVEVDGVGDPVAIVLAHLVLIPAIRPRNRDPRRGSSRPRSSRR